MSNRPLILIVGLQKSGTTLLERLLLKSGAVDVLIEGEGDVFWGNEPPFSPAAFPAGAIYQRAGGDRGHEADARDATDEIRTHLRERYQQRARAGRIMMNKNPYNTLRLPWLRSIFPRAVIVATVRRPVPSVFSLRKKYIDHDERGLPPEDGWWGAKPQGWREHVTSDKLAQCAWQWRAVNARLVDDRSSVDHVIAYDALCRDPLTYVNRVLSLAGGPRASGLAPLRCFDDEFGVGSQLRSKNRHFGEAGSLEVPREEVIELGPLGTTETAMIEETCASIADRLEVFG